MKIGIVAHKDRLDTSHNLVKTVAADYVSIDQGELGPTANHIKVWEHLVAISGMDEWLIVLEDDVLPCNDFRSEAAHALRWVPLDSDVVSFYMGMQRPPHWQDRVASALAKADETQACWIVGDYVLHGVALAMRHEHAAKMVHAVRHSRRPIDEAISVWCRAFGHRVAYAVPSPCDHLDMPTIIQHPDGEQREPGRVAWRFGVRTHWNGARVLL